MKLQIIGIEGTVGVSGKSGKPYEIGNLHSLARLAPPLDDSNIAGGFMGTTYRCSVAIIKSIAHLPRPFMAEVEVEDIMRFGKREQEVMSVHPEKLIAK